MSSLVLTNSLNLGPFFSNDLFSDAFFTKDNVALIPIHRSIMAGVSTRFRAMFEENLDRKVIAVPLVDFETLQKIVKFIYSSSVSFEKQEELEDFRNALDFLKFEVPGIKEGTQSVDLKGSETDENLNSRPFEEAAQEDLTDKKQESLVKEKQQEDSMGQEKGEEAPLTVASEAKSQRTAVTAPSRSPSPQRKLTISRRPPHSRRSSPSANPGVQSCKVSSTHKQAKLSRSSSSQRKFTGSRSLSSLPGKSSSLKAFDLRDKIRNKQMGVEVDVCGEVGDGEGVGEDGSSSYRFNPLMPRPDPDFPANLQVYFPSIPGALDQVQLRKGCQWGDLRTERVFALPGDYTITTSGYAVFEEEWMAHQVLAYGYVTANVYREELLVQQGLQVLAVEFPQQHGVKQVMQHCHDHGVKREYQEESRQNSSKRTKVEVKAKVKEEIDDGTISNL